MISRAGEKYRDRRCKIKGRREKYLKRRKLQDGWEQCITRIIIIVLHANITGVIKSGTAARHVACKGRKRNTRTVLFGKADGRALLGRRRRTVEDDIKIILKNKMGLHKLYYSLL